MLKYQGEIIKLLPPPAKKVAAAGDWATFEQSLNTPLPDDFKWFVSNYGAGGIGTSGRTEPFMQFFSPFDNTEHGFAKRMAVALSDMESYVEDFYGGTRIYSTEGRPVPLRFAIKTSSYSRLICQTSNRQRRGVPRNPDPIGCRT
jgi:hypothetical protein